VQNSLYGVTNDDLRRLDAKEAVALISELLWAEATRLGIPISKIHISAEVNTPDDGVDATSSDHTFTGDLIRAGHTAYQIKSGKSFELQQEAVIRGELFGVHPPSKANLKRRIRDCLDENGTYILVCTGIDPVDPALALGHLRKFFTACGYANPKCEVWMQNQLCGFLTKYPSIALHVNGREAGQLRTHRSWAGDAEMGLPFKPGTNQLNLISNLKAALRASGTAVHVHVRGEAGIGKTRLVLEATRDIDLQPLILYTNRPAEFLDCDFMATIAREDNQFAVILVVDECGPDHRTQIWNRLKSRGQRIKLVTIFNEWEDSSGISFLDAPLLEREKIVQIIEGYSISKDQAERFADFCSGSPRVAHVVGSNLQKNPEDLLKPTDTVNIWERYVVGIDDPNSPDVKDRFAVLRHIALFKRFGYGDPVISEAKAISAIVQKGYPHITWPKFQEVIADIRKRKILQGETTLYITPKFLHIWLWVDWWNHHGSGFALEEFAKDLKGNLLPWFFEMFRYAEQSRVARTVVSNLLGHNGPLQDREFLDSRLGGDFFLALTDVDPKQALACLQRTVGTWSRDELLTFRNGRRGAIWALEKIAIWKDLFRGAASLLLKLAEAENETWANNATGVFAELFSPGYGDVAPSEASPQERFPILEEALVSDSEITRAIALKACDAALEAQHFSRTVGAEHQGFKPKPKLWTPQTYGEIWDAYRKVWSLLRKQLPALPPEQRTQAIRTLFDNGAAIAAATNLGELVLETWKEILHSGWATTAETLEHLIFLLRYRRNELRPETITAAEALRDELVGTDFPSLLKRYVAMDLLEDQFDDKDQPTDTRDKKIQALAEECAKQPDLLQPELSWLVTEEAKNGYRFGYELAKLDKSKAFLKEIVEAQRNRAPKSTPFFLSGYMRAVFEAEPNKWEQLLEEFAADNRLRTHVPELTWRSGMTDQAALRILKLAQAGQMEVGQFGMFCLGSVIKELSERVFREWAEFLVEQPDAGSVRILVNLMHFYYLDSKTGRKLPPDLALQALGHAALFQKGGQFHTMDQYHWAAVGSAFAAHYPKESLTLAKTIVEHFGEEGTIVGRFHSNAHKVLIEITRQNPREVWRLVSERLGPPIDSRAFHLKSWLRGDKYSPAGENGVLPLIPLEVVWNWVDANRERRAWYLASFVPKQLFRSSEKPCLAREVLIRYGADSSIRNNLIANFSTEGWSGPASLHYRKKKQQLLDFKKEETDANVKLWIDEYADDLQRQIEHAKIHEEREAF
jgi:hypothetical protein